MSDDAQRWKEKYLKSIEQQDTLERRWAARLDLLRRGLVRSTLAAEGTDRAVDQCMKEMRDVVRTDDMDAALAALLPRLEKAVLDSEQRRETRIDQMSTALAALVAQLQKLPLPREVARPLKTFAKQLDSRVGQAREIPLLLSELSSLQGQALNNLEPDGETPRPGPGLLQRLFGAKDVANEALAGEPAPPPSAPPSSPPPAAASRPAPEPVAEEPAQSDELAQALRAFAPLPQGSAPPPPEPVAPAKVVEIVTPSVAVEAAPRTAPIARPVEVAEPEAPPVEAQEPAPESALAAFIETAPVQVDALQQTVIGSLSLPPVLEVPDPDELQADSVYALPDSPEPSYSSVAKHI